MKTTTMREAQEGQTKVWYALTNEGQTVELIAAELDGEALELWEIAPGERRNLLAIAERHADQRDADMRGGETP